MWGSCVAMWAGCAPLAAEEVGVLRTGMPHVRYGKVTVFIKILAMGRARQHSIQFGFWGRGEAEVRISFIYGSFRENSQSAAHVKAGSPPHS